MIRLLSDTRYLMMRALRETARQPALEIGNVFIPFFFFAVTVGAIGQVSGKAFGVENYTAFQLPVAILQAIAGASGTAGFGTVTDIERGYFDKLLLTPTPRVALVLGRLAADGVRTMALTLLIVVVGLLFGTGMHTGPLGVVVLVLMGGAFGLSYSGIGMALALKTGSAQAAQLGFLVFFPLVFLSPAFAPKEVFAGWLQVLATINPVTYIVEGMRDIVSSGWDLGSLAACLGAIAGLGTFTMTLVALGLKSRTT